MSFKAFIDLTSKDKTQDYADACFKAGYIAMKFYKNEQVAARYFKEAALRGNIPAAWHNLGLLCEQGAMNLSSDKIPGEAYQYYARAANAGMPESMYNAGRMCILAGMEDEAREWMRKAADKGFAPAKKWLKFDRIGNGGSLWNFFVRQYRAARALSFFYGSLGFAEAFPSAIIFYPKRRLLVSAADRHNVKPEHV